MKIRIAFLFVALAAASLFGAGQVKQSALDVSLIRLIASPKEHAGKVVRVIGYLHLEFEGDGIYVHKEDYEQSLTKNGLWVDAPAEIKKEMMKMNDHYVLIEGVFDPEHTGHMGLWSGEIVQINRAIPWAIGPGEKK